MKSWIRYKYSTKDTYGQLRYKIKTLKLNKLPTDSMGHVNMDECNRIATESAKADPKFYGLVWHQTNY